MVFKRPRNQRVADIRGTSIVDVGRGLGIKVYGSVNRGKREHDRSVGDESQLGASPGAVYGIEQRAHTLEEQCSDNPWNDESGKRSEREIDPHVVGRTIQNRTDEKSGEISLLRKVE